MGIIRRFLGGYKYKMRLEVLVATMHQTDYSILNKMNIRSDAIIINQCEMNRFEEFEHRGRRIRYISLAERGVGLSRNNALMRASGDICLFADDDVEYLDSYEELVLDAFKKNPKADVIMFNVPSTNKERQTYIIPSKYNVGRLNCLRFGAVKIAARTEKVRQANVFFSLLFGGGSKYSSGEDSLFVAECIRKGLRIIAVPTVIGHVLQIESSWFKGYTDKFFIDKGVFFACLSKRWAYLLCIQFVIRHQKLFKEEKSIIEAFKLMIQGIKEIKYVV